MIDDVMLTAEDKMQKSCAAYERDMMGLRAGRANPQLLDRILVDYYGTPTPIPQIGNISSPEPPTATAMNGRISTGCATRTGC